MSSRLVVLGALGAALAACSEPLELSSTEQAATVSPGSYDFGTATVGTEIGPRSFTVSYGIGFGFDTVLAITTCPDFRVDLAGNSLPYEIYRICETGQFQFACEFIDYQTLMFDVYFRPSVANVESCNMVIDLENGLDKVVPLSGTGTAPPIDITVVQPGGMMIDFGDVLGGATSAPRTVTVRSDGGSALDITGVSVAGAGFAQPTGTAPITLAPNQTADYTLTCTPPGPGVITGSFTITSNDPDEGTIPISLRCNGIQSALAINPSPATLPATRVGESSEIQIDLVNSGTASLMIDSVSVTGAGLSITQQPATMQLPATGGMTSLRVGFTPTMDGDVSGMLTVNYDGTQVRQIAVTAPGRVATLSVTPSGQVDFGPICVGQSDARLFVALDTGSGGFVVQTVSLAGSGFSLTPINPTTYPATVPPLGGGTVTFQVGAAPAMAGDLNATVSIATDIPGIAAQTIGVHALGLAGGTTTTPTELDTGAAAVGEGAGARLVVLSNCEVDPLTIVSFQIDGPDASQFAIVTAPLSMEIPPATSASWAIELKPTTPGAKTATFHIVHSRGSADVALVGDGLDDSGQAGAGPRGSYYACGTGRDPGGLVVIVIAVGLAVGGRRRRRSVR